MKLVLIAIFLMLASLSGCSASGIRIAEEVIEDVAAEELEKG